MSGGLLAILRLSNTQSQAKGRYFREKLIRHELILDFMLWDIKSNVFEIIQHEKSSERYIFLPIFEIEG